MVGQRKPEGGGFGEPALGFGIASSFSRDATVAGQAKLTLNGERLLCGVGGLVGLHLNSSGIGLACRVVALS